MDRLPTKDVQTLNLGGEWRAAQSVRAVLSICYVFAALSHAVCMHPSDSQCKSILATRDFAAATGWQPSCRTAPWKNSETDLRTDELIFIQQWVGSFHTSHFVPALLCLISERRPCDEYLYGARVAVSQHCSWVVRPAEDRQSHIWYHDR